MEVRASGAGLEDKLEAGLYYAAKGSLWERSPWFISTDKHEKYIDPASASGDFKPVFRCLRAVKHYLGQPKVWFFNIGTNPRGQEGFSYCSQFDDLEEFLEGKFQDGRVGATKEFIFYENSHPKELTFAYVHPSRCGADVGPHLFVLSDAQYGRSDYIAQDEKYGGFLPPGGAGFDAISEYQLGGGFTSIMDGNDIDKPGK